MKLIKLMKQKKLVTGLSTALLLVLVVLLIWLPQMNQRKIGVPPEQIIKTGYFQDSEGIKDAHYKDLIVPGQYKEAVANQKYLLTSDTAGTLTLTRVGNRDNIPIDVPAHAYQLKAIGNDFGFLQLRGNKQYITFLDPETGKTSPVETSTNVISWDASGTDIAYHLYETTTLGFAKYDNNLGWTDQKEFDAGITTLSQMFSKEGKNYVWVVTTDFKNKFYAVETHEDVTDQFPLLARLEQNNGVLAAIVGDYWVLTAPTSGTAGNQRLTTQVWDKEGSVVLDLSSLGYELMGTVLHGNGKLYLPVTFSNSTTADGILIMDENTHSTDYEEGLRTYITDTP